MNIKLGTYEIFSRIVPGSLYIFAVVQLLMVLEVIDINWHIMNDVSIVSSIGVFIAAYIVSEALDRLALVWFRIFRKRGFSAQVLVDFKIRHQDKWKIDFEDNDLHTLLAYIRTKDLELSGEIERHNAISIMLRNVSFGLLLIAFNVVIMFMLHRDSLYLIAGFVVLIFSIVIIREAIKFRQWFYSGIFETIIAYRLDLEKIVKPIRNIARQKSSKKGYE